MKVAQISDDRGEYLRKEKSLSMTARLEGIILVQRDHEVGSTSTIFEFITNLRSP